MDALIQELRDAFNYDPETGLVTRKKRSGNSKVGYVVGSCKYDKYGNLKFLTVKYKNKSYVLNRLIWVIHYGKWPTYQVDHKDRDPSHNWITNLRDIPGKLNALNKGTYRSNTLGVKGVSTEGNRFRCSITINSKKKHIGMFDTAEEAHAAYLEAKEKYHTAVIAQYEANNA